MESKTVLYLGNMLSKHGLTPTTVETLGNRLAIDINLLRASDKKNKVLRLLDMLFTIWRNRSKIDFVIIDTYSSSAFKFATLGAAFCRMNSIPYVAYLHGGDLPNRFTNSPEASKKYILGAKWVIAPSGYLASSVKEHFKAEAKVIPNFIDLENYKFTQRHSQQEPNILWVRSFHSTYQPELAVETVAELHMQGHKATLTMVGPDKDGSMEKCKELAKELGIESSVTFTGRLPKEAWIAKSIDFDIFLNTTSVDNTPVSVMEAMALGMPVVTTKVGGIPFLFEDGKEGIMVEKQTPKALVEAIMSLTNQSSDILSISREARKKAEEWDWAVVRKKWLTLFNTI